MGAPSKSKRIAGWIMLCLACAIMVYSGTVKLLGTAPDYVTEGLQESGLSEETILIGVAEIVSAILLLIPRTSSLGILLVSSFWGGAIVSHMAKDDAYTVPSVLLILCWVAAFLRDSKLLGSFTRDRESS